MKDRPALIVATLALFVALAGRTQADPPKANLVVQELVVVDKAGKERIKLRVGPKGPELRMLDSKGVSHIELSGLGPGRDPGLVVVGAADKGFARAAVLEAGRLTISGKDTVRVGPSGVTIRHRKGKVLKTVFSAP